MWLTSRAGGWRSSRWGVRSPFHMTLCSLIQVGKDWSSFKVPLKWWIANYKLLKKFCRDRDNNLIKFSRFLFWRKSDYKIKICLSQLVIVGESFSQSMAALIVDVLKHSQKKAGSARKGFVEFLFASSEPFLWQISDHPLLPLLKQHWLTAPIPATTFIWLDMSQHNNSSIINL